MDDDSTDDDSTGPHGQARRGGSGDQVPGDRAILDGGAIGRGAIGGGAIGGEAIGGEAFGGTDSGGHLGLIGFAHRGASAWYQRENTLGAFDRALARGATGLESDVWLTADGVAVLHHDGDVGLGRRRVSDTVSSRLPRWLPTLADFYEFCGYDFDLSLDIKGPHGHTTEAAAAVVEAARKAGGDQAVARTWLCGSIDALSAWRQIDARVRLVNSTSLRSVQDLGGFTAYSSRLADYGIDAVNLRAREWTEQSATEGLPVLRAAGLRAFGWGAQSNRVLRRLVRFGLNGIYSDHLARLVTATQVGPADPA